MYVSDLAATGRRSSSASWVPSEAAVERAASDLRLALAERLGGGEREPPRRRHDDLDFILAQRGRKKKRGATDQAPPPRAA